MTHDSPPQSHSTDQHNHERRFQGGADRLRAAERVALLEVERVVTLSLDNLTGRTMLDVGTGTGLFAEAFAARGLEVSGIDVNAELLTAARQHVPSGHFQEAPMEQLPFPDQSFDLVFMGLVLHEADDALVALREARRVARQRVAVLEWPYREEPKGPPMAHRLPPDTIEALAVNAGYRQVTSLHLQHMDLYQFAV